LQIIYRFPVFKESAYGLQHALTQLYVTSTVTEAPDDLESEPGWVHAFARLDVLFIVYGGHLFEQLPRRYILMQMEQLSSPYVTDKYLHSMTEALQVWDFSFYNAAVLRRRTNLGNAISVIPAFVRGMQTTDPGTCVAQSIDVLFYGHLNERREGILQRLQAANLTVRYEHNVLGAQRDELIRQSKVVLNLHYLPDAALEVHRINPLLVLGKCIVSEPSIDAQLDAHYSSGIVFAYSVDIAHAVQALVADDSQRKWWEGNALALHRKMRCDLVTLRGGFERAFRVQGDKPCSSLRPN
jgi:hypothetical protein